MSDRPLPLDGVRVIDLTHHAAGPMCTMLLGDYGAEVIKVEPPKGDSFRTSGTVRVSGEHVGFIALNRNKKSVVIDLKSEGGRSAALDLVRSADVVIENFRPGAMDRLGLGFDELKRVNPAIIYCSISAFGSDGPMRNKQGLDVVLQAMSGIMSITGTPDSGPLPCGAPIADIFSGVMAAFGVVTAIVEQRKDGPPRAQRVELSMLDAMISMLGLRYQQVLATGEEMPRIGAAHPQACPWDVYHASDKPFVIAATTDEYWRRLCVGLGIPHLAHDPRYARISDRVARRSEVNRLLANIFRTKPRDHWLERIDAADVPNGPVNSLNDILADRELRKRETFIDVSYADVPALSLVNAPVRFDNRPSARRPPPLLGEHNDAMAGTRFTPSNENHPS